ncbi:MAG: fatty acid--CoA ligase family protein [Veillonellales bacterium]
MLIHDCVSWQKKEIEDKVCLIHGKSSFTYSQMRQKVDFLARRLAGIIKPGDRVLLKQADPVLQLLYFFGILKAGGCCVFIDAATTDEVCLKLIRLHHISVYINEDFHLPDTAADTLPTVQPTDIFLGALSSGSTGNPKLIWRDHSSWTRAFPQQSRVFCLCGKDRLFLAGSLIYTANLNACMHMLSLGGTVVIADSRQPRTWVRGILKNQISGIFMVPAHYRILLKALEQPLLGIKSLVTCGAKLDPVTVRQMVERFPQAGIYEYYGASELGHVSCMTKDDLLYRPDSVGKPFPGVRVWIEQDVIWAESPYLAPAYRPRSTAGDLGRMDGDGYLYVLGRRNGLINSGGVKIIPEQVAKVIDQCPGVSRTVVGGIDDPVKGQRVCAWIIKENPALTTATILAFCRTKLRSHYYPQKIVFVSQFPLNASGKIDLPRLRQGFHE